MFVIVLSGFVLHTLNQGRHYFVIYVANHNFNPTLPTADGRKECHKSTPTFSLFLFLEGNGPSQSCEVKHFDMLVENNHEL